MNAFDAYKLHNGTITQYLYGYVFVLLVFMISAFVWFKFIRPTSFSKSLFYTIFIAGLVLGGSAIAFISKNRQDVSSFAAAYQKDANAFLSERIEAAKEYQAHFDNLLRIWSVVIFVLAITGIIGYRRPILAGICTGLVVYCISSLSLDYAGFRSDRQYFANLQQIRHHSAPSTPN